MYKVSRRGLWLAVVLSLLAAQSVFAFGSTTPRHSTASSRPVSTREVGRLPLSFVPGSSANDAGTGFRLDRAGASLAFTPGEVLFSLSGAPRATTALKSPARGSAAEAMDRHIPRARAAEPTLVRLQFEGADRTAELVGGERLPGVATYLLGNDPAKWLTNVPTYGSILYRQLYPGIDLRYDGN
ncbi:MAG TPA: hypothetical protein VER55_12120, partial [Ardenticatenaceae bacterium]|nr:hypothetical protein [Ardenticatenaceae bacterium]